MTQEAKSCALSAWLLPGAMGMEPNEAINKSARETFEHLKVRNVVVIASYGLVCCFSNRGEKVSMGILK